MKRIALVIGILSAVLLGGCYPGENFGFKANVQISYSEGGLYCANIKGNYEILEGSPQITEVGVCWKSYDEEEEMLTREKRNKVAETTNNSFEIHLDNLRDNKTYYIRPYIVADGFCVYGEKAEFSTPAAEIFLPVLGNVESSEKDLDKLLVSASVEIKVPEYPIIESGFYYSNNYSDVINRKAPTISAKVKDGKLTAEITNLIHSTTYYICAYAKSKAGVCYGKIATLSTSGDEYAPVLSGITVTKKGPTYIKASCHVTVPGKGDEISEAYFNYRKSSSSTTTRIKASIKDDKMEAEITGLQASTYYIVKAYVKNSYGEATSSDLSVSTPSTSESQPTATIPVVSDITPQGAHLSATIKLVDEAYIVKESGFQYSTSSYMGYDATSVKGILDQGHLTLDLTGLQKTTKYYVRAYVTTELGTVYGNTESFTTTNYIPEFSELTFSNLTNSTVDLATEVIPYDAAHPVTEAGFQYSTSSLGSYDTKHPGILNGKSLTLHLEKLADKRSYYIRAYAQCEGVYYYGETQIVTTKSISDYAPTASAVTTSDLLMSSVKFSATVKEVSATYPILSAGFQYYQSSNPSSVSYGTRKEGVISGNTVTFTATGLQEGSIYQVRAYTVCSSGTYYGDTKSFTTLSRTDLPSVVCHDITNMTTNSFYISATTTLNNNAYPVTEAGFLYVKTNSTIKLTMDTDGAIRKKISPSGKNISTTILGLEANSSYLVRAYVMSGSYVIYSDLTIRVYTDLSKCTPVLGTFTLTKTNGEVTASCSVNSSGGFTVTEYGFVYSSTLSNPTLESNERIINLTNTGKFVEKLALPKPDTGSKYYYVRAYARNAQGITYTSNKSVSIAWND